MDKKFSQEFIIEYQKLLDKYDVIVREISPTDKINDKFSLNMLGEQSKFYFVNDENEFIVEAGDNLNLVNSKTLNWNFRETGFLSELRILTFKYNIKIEQEDLKNELKYP